MADDKKLSEELEETDLCEPESETTEEETPAEDFSPTPSEDEEKTSEPTEVLPKKLPYHERYYLQYHTKDALPDLDFEATRGFLNGIGFDGGELKQAREGKNFFENFGENQNSKPGHMYCSYCGNKISGVEFSRLSDGRLRCTTCSNSVVKTKAEAEEIYKRVLSNLENFFGATINVPVDIEILDEIRLKRKIGVPLGTRDDQSVLILGVAVNKKNSYKILLENGVPRISLIATFAHELTHIWQYTHWDNNKGFKKCPACNRLIVYEGMAKWVEIQYLYLIGEAAVARREEQITRKRQDEYGIGFCIYEDRYPITREAMVCEETPFTPNSYPLN